MAEGFRHPPIVPYITVRDAAAALDFYKAGFGAREAVRIPNEDGSRIIHAAIFVNGGLIMISDGFKEYGGAEPLDPASTYSFAINVELQSAAEVDEMHARAVEAGGHSAMEPGDMVWGARFGVVRDPFGYRWMLNAALPK